MGRSIEGQGFRILVTALFAEILSINSDREIRRENIEQSKVGN